MTTTVLPPRSFFSRRRISRPREFFGITGFGGFSRRGAATAGTGFFTSGSGAGARFFSASTSPSMAKGLLCSGAAGRSTLIFLSFGRLMPVRLDALCDVAAEQLATLRDLVLAQLLEPAQAEFLAAE